MSGWSTLQRAALCTVELSCLRKVPFPSASSVMWPSPRGEEAYRALNQRLWALESDGLAPHLLRQQTREQTAAVKEEMEPVWQRVQRAQYTSDTAYAKHERYCRDQRVLLRQLADLTAYERPMHELDNRKDHIMALCTVAVANLAMWVRDEYFPADYAHATWQRLAPFFRLPGRIMPGAETLCVELRPFNDRRLRGDLTLLCARVQTLQPRLPDGRRLIFTVAGEASRALDMQQEAVA